MKISASSSCLTLSLKVGVNRIRTNLNVLITSFTLLLCCGSFISTLSQQAYAEDAMIPIHSSEDLESAVGYVISENSLSSDIPAQIKLLPDGRRIVSFDIGSVDRSNIYVSAKIKTKSGRSFFLDVTDVKSPDMITQPIPSCVRNSKMPFVQSQLENLKSLTENRYTQRGLIKEKIARDLDNQETKRIFNLERALGLMEQNPMSADMHPIDLIKREFRLIAALKRWEDSKIVKNPPLPPPNTEE